MPNIVHSDQMTQSVMSDLVWFYIVYLSLSVHILRVIMVIHISNTADLVYDELIDNTVYNLITADTPISAQSSISLSSDYRLCTFIYFFIDTKV